MTRSILAILLLLPLTSACGGSGGRFSDEGAEADYAASYREEEQPDMDAVQSARDEVQEKLESLELEVSRFGGENWRYVVPDVELALDEAGSALDDLEDLLRRENIEDRVDTSAIRSRIESVRAQVDGFQDTRGWDEAVQGTESEMGFDSEMDDLESEISSAAAEEEPEYGEGEY